MKVFLVDDHAILLDGIKSLLSKEASLEVCGEAHSAEDALDFLKKNAVDLLITDFNLPNMDGLSLVRLVKKISPDTKILMLSMHDETHLVKEILKEGVSGYVLKNDSHRELLQAIETIKNGKIYLSNDINRIIINSLQFPDEERLLTDREREILKLIAKEFSNKDIAEQLFISERTVETHRKNIFRKTKTNTLVGLIKFAYANNLI
ncbi:Receiver component of a two-component response regulator [Indibacter alkaliphilus LW1]|uniref:Receiver component of a two-component response regulator n=1 Tax=Indibacter alkaliphilus (strain CCUG 57479 / KCTC 22604 / LW1) TaxID=1189612 RepID=S2DQZ8_INDAL|nr:response regulator transcription factor [Indibacter alkaliphilus]EOZ92328.1 Receiver component of a two-component response regulator [Indibacter alkaliphilus LW1]